jgi:hypothetical protein
MRDWEETFRSWAKPPGSTEEQRIGNAEKAIKDAIAASDALKSRDVRTFTQGSYQNNTNVRQDSDVDVAVVCYDVFFPDYPDGTTKETFGNIDGNYAYATFKNEVEQALVARFGRAAVKRGNKAFDVHENTYRVEADVAPFFEHRRYQTGGSYLSGVELRPDNGKPTKVINWPQQHYDNGVAKNTATGKRYKALVRVLKCLRNEMADADYSEAKPIPGFLLECLVWNVPNDHLGHVTYKADVRACLAFLFKNTRTDDTCSEWGEVSELKYLFRTSQKWTRQQAHSFLSKAWDYIGFE